MARYWENLRDSIMNVFIVVICLILVAIGVGIISGDWKSCYYHETVGTIVSCDVEVSKITTSFLKLTYHTCTPKVHYVYTVDDKHYSTVTTKDSVVTSKRSDSSDHVSKARNDRELRDESEHITALLKIKWRAGKTFPIYYDSAQPHHCVLQKGFTMWDAGLLPCVIFFACIPLFMLCKLLNRKYMRYFLNEDAWFRSFPIQEDGEVLRLSIGFVDPVYYSLSGIVASSIYAVILVICNHYFFGIITSPYQVCLIALGMILASSFWGFRIAIIKNRSVHCILTVDKTRNELTLPRQPDKTPGPIVPFDAFVELVLSQVTTNVNKKTGKETIHHTLMLRYYQTKNEVKSAIVASSHSFYSQMLSDDKKLSELAELKKRIMDELGRDEQAEIDSFFAEYGCDVQAVDDKGRTLLHHAATTAKMVVARLLVSDGADVMAKDADGFTPLDYAIEEENPAMVEFLEMVTTEVEIQAEKQRMAKILEEKNMKREKIENAIGCGCILGFIAWCTTLLVLLIKFDYSTKTAFIIATIATVITVVVSMWLRYLSLRKKKG